MARLALTKDLARPGVCRVACVIMSSGEIPAEDDLAEMERLREKRHGKANAKARFLVLFDNMAKYGQISRKRFRREMNGFCAFRHEVANVQVRFPCFRGGNDWIVTHGFKKPGAQSGLGQWPQGEIARAKHIRSEYVRRKSQQ